MWIRLCFMVCLALLLSACSSTRTVKNNAWPEAMPSRSYFENLYRADIANQAMQSEADYLGWIVRFYEGWELYRRGWKKMTGELLENIDDPVQRQKISLNMTALGRMIAGEWAKKSPDRRIYTRHVSVWGNALLEGIARGEEARIVSSIKQDVIHLLDKKIPVEAIIPERYYARTEDESFW